MAKTWYKYQKGHAFVPIRD